MTQNHKIVAVSSYGLFCLSPDVFDDFLKSNKIKTGKLTKFFDKNKELLEQAMLEGAWLPVSIINSVDYLIDVGYESTVFTNDWQEVLSLPNCNLNVSTEGVWVGSLGSVDNWKADDYKGQTAVSYKTMDGETLYIAHKFNIDKGIYKVTIRGFKRKQKEPYPVVNFGFFFELQPTDKFTDFANPLTQNVNIAKM